VDWRYKAALQNVFSLSPGGDRLNYIFQKHVTRSAGVDEASFRDIVGWATSHVEAIRRYETSPLSQLTFYEFGAGYHLIGALTFFAYGVDRQIIVDIRPLLKPDLVNYVIADFRQFELGLDLQRIPGKEIDEAHPADSLEELYGIRYFAPRDARDTELASRSVDCITSTSTLEHISPNDIGAILRECHRILRPEGLLSMSVDYADHYSHFDKSISEYNFLRYSERAWKLFNPPLHYQNRLRHPDYVQLFESNRFEIVEERRREGSPADLAIVLAMPLAKRFERYTAEDLAARGASFVLRKQRS
jgi:SAM-dependent methyltransferase